MRGGGACTDASCWPSRWWHLLGGAARRVFGEVAGTGRTCSQLPHQSEANRRIRWLWGAFEQLRAMLAARLPTDDCQQIDTTALPVKHTSRVRGPDGWTGPGNDLAARFGRDAAHAEWFYGFRLAIKADLGSRVVRAWSIVPAAVNERESPATCSRPGRHLVTCCAIRVSTAGRSLPPRPPRHRRPGPARQGPARPHARPLAEGHRPMAQPDRGQLRRDHRADGIDPARRSHLLGAAHQNRSDHRRPH